jgi:hypothetical protein
VRTGPPTDLRPHLPAACHLTRRSGSPVSKPISKTASPPTHTASSKPARPAWTLAGQRLGTETSAGVAPASGEEPAPVEAVQRGARRVPVVPEDQAQLPRNRRWQPSATRLPTWRWQRRQADTLRDGARLRAVSVDRCGSGCTPRSGSASQQLRHVTSVQHTLL